MDLEPAYERVLANTGFDLKAHLMAPLPAECYALFRPDPLPHAGSRPLETKQTIFVCDSHAIHMAMAWPSRLSETQEWPLGSGASVMETRDSQLST